MIPGIPTQTRISILQQTDVDSKDDDREANGQDPAARKTEHSGLSVWEEVIDRATSRGEIQREIDGMYYYSSFHVLG